MNKRMGGNGSVGTHVCFYSNNPCVLCGVCLFLRALLDEIHNCLCVDPYKSIDTRSIDACMCAVAKDLRSKEGFPESDTRFALSIHRKNAISFAFGRPGSMVCSEGRWNLVLHERGSSIFPKIVNLPHFLVCETKSVPSVPIL
jgi:hypothetical protein